MDENEEFKKMVMKTSNEIFGLYEAKGNKEYYGEEVTQLEHASQCAMLAQEEGCTDMVILGAFLHDIGHLLDGFEPMLNEDMNIGNMKHETVGADFLEGLGVPPAVSCIARHHVNAKRYLCHKQPAYYQKLSDASKKTLEHQGGVMSKAEAEAFEKNPHLEIILRGRHWDEQAKVKGLEVTPISVFRDMFENYMMKGESK